MITVQAHMFLQRLSAYMGYLCWGWRAVVHIMWDRWGWVNLMLLYCMGGGGDTLLLVYIHVCPSLLENFGLFRRLDLLIDRALLKD